MPWRHGTGGHGSDVLQQVVQGQTGGGRTPVTTSSCLAFRVWLRVLGIEKSKICILNILSMRQVGIEGHIGVEFCLHKINPIIL